MIRPSATTGANTPQCELLSAPRGDSSGLNIDCVVRVSCGFCQLLARELTAPNRRRNHHHVQTERCPPRCRPCFLEGNKFISVVGRVTIEEKKKQREGDKTLAQNAKDGTAGLSR